jgi:hypothetical protein
MKRDYLTGTSENIDFFIGNEVEHTPAFGMRTLFVTGVQNEQIIEHFLNEENSYNDTSKHIKHIFFGANHSFNPGYDDYEDWKRWESMIEHFLDQGYWCSLDIPMAAVEQFNDGGLNDHNKFIPQIRVPIPYIKLWNYNTMLKIDDKDFAATNPGVWCHNLRDLMGRNRFTDWDQYGKDEILK